MQALIEMIIGFIALLAAAALSQFGLQVDAPTKSEREVHRVQDCSDAPVTGAITPTSRRHDC
ncbi:hypothetical protein GCM10009116_12790 [Brevundimonas basaltis]|uniref:Uncharacterized protein n=1 Tax=Brevundimonas basaltis TaxID=472166 RepID=A0A7W8MFB1_9CAUL|nr:hypothetical protein [Brevundimonas basaltis]MBB5290715.1 hypothetical protein [Brevundimonas basaltis]